jgi:hypothetical protein
VCADSLQHIQGEGSVSGISWLSKKASFGDSTGLEEPIKLFEHSYGTVMEMKINNDRPGAARIFAICQILRLQLKVAELRRIKLRRVLHVYILHASNLCLTAYWASCRRCHHA